MAVYDVGGQEFEVPDDVQGQQLNAVLGQLAQKVSAEAPKPDEPTAEISGLAAAGAGFRRGVETLTGGFAQRMFEGAQGRVDERLAELADGINSGQIPANEENLAKFDELSSLSGEIKETLRGAEQRELQRRAEIEPTKKAFPLSTLAGDIGGQVVTSLAGGALLGPTGVPSTLTGRAAISGVSGALTGASQATVGDESAVEKAALGGALGFFVPPALERVLLPIVKGASAPVVNFIRSIGQTRPDKFKQGKFQSSLDTSSKTKKTEGFEAFDDVTSAVSAKPGSSPEQVARVAAFKEAGITPAARSRISGSNDDFQRETQLLRQRDSEAADKIRDNFFRESEELQQGVREVSESLGISEASGQSVKNSLDDIQTSFGASKRAAYGELDEAISKADPELIKSIPVGTGQIKDSIVDSQRRFLQGAEAQRVDELMAEFGMFGEPGKKVGRFTPVDVGEAAPINIRGDVTPLNLGNFEQFRIRINDLFDISKPKEAAARSNIIRSIDNEMDEVIEGAGKNSLSSEILGSAKAARGLARKEKLIFDQKDLVSRLIGTKKGSVTPLVEASKAFDVIKGAPPEQVGKLLKVLRSTDDGNAAIGNLGSSIVVDLLNSATKAGGKQLVGPQGQKVVDISGTNFTKAINSYGPTPAQSRKLIKSIIGDGAFKKMLKLEAIGQFRISPDTAVQKGSAPDLVNQFIRSSAILNKLPLIGGKIADVGESVAQKRELAKVSNIKADELDDATKDFIIFNAPRLAVIFGLVQEDK